MTTFESGLNIASVAEPLGLTYGDGTFGPEVEVRRLEDIRQSLKDPKASGPEDLYAIAMDVGRDEHREDLIERHLLYGVVTYAAGQVGDEPVRSQGHIHAKSPRNGWSTPELYEIWSGTGIILMQESAKDEPGRCFAVKAGPGEVVVVPPGWAHATISADPSQALTFGAWCDRAYGFDYEDVRAHGGLAWFPTLSKGDISWVSNERYRESELVEASPRIYTELGLKEGLSIYEQYAQNPEVFMWVPNPELKARAWENFSPI